MEIFLAQTRGYFEAEDKDKFLNELGRLKQEYNKLKSELYGGRR
jgi:hypothetical protein